MQERNKFKLRTLEQISEIEQKKKDIKSSIEAVARRGAECLDDLKFKDYKIEFEAMVDDVFTKLEYPIDPDPIKDAHFLRACINSILFLKRLTKRPERDIKKGVKS